VSSGRSIPLDDVRADGWFDRLAEDSPSFGRLCEVVGARFVAFSVIAGVRITALTIDRRAPDASLIDFVVAEDGGEQRLPLGEFQRRLVAALLADESMSPAFLEAESAEAIQEYIGFRYVLLAPIFDIGLKTLRLHDIEAPSLVLDLEGQEEAMAVSSFRELVCDRIRAELQRTRPASPFSIDLGAIPEAEAAMRRDDFERAIELLGAWPGPLSLLLRTTEGQQLTSDVKATLARALGLLGTAYVKSERFDWAEEVMRLGIQWGQDSPAAGDLFRRMGEAFVVRGREGEAIGFLRRALALAAPRRECLPLLARAYAARERWVAAVLCAEEAVALGCDPDTEGLGSVHREGQAMLGVAWTRFRAEVPAPSLDRTTIPAPPSNPPPSNAPPANEGA
jgi:tetratricopeptide (TPR) repeat protein